MNKMADDKGKLEQENVDNLVKEAKLKDTSGMDISKVDFTKSLRKPDSTVGMDYGKEDELKRQLMGVR